MSEVRNPVRDALAFWQGIASENGWTIGSLTVWIDRNGNAVDSVATRDGGRQVYVVGPNGETVAELDIDTL